MEQRTTMRSDGWHSNSLLNLNNDILNIISKYLLFLNTDTINKCFKQYELNSILRNYIQDQLKLDVDISEHIRLDIVGLKKRSMVDLICNKTRPNKSRQSLKLEFLKYLKNDLVLKYGDPLLASSAIFIKYDINDYIMNKYNYGDSDDIFDYIFRYKYSCCRGHPLYKILKQSKKTCTVVQYSVTKIAFKSLTDDAIFNFNIPHNDIKYDRTNKTISYKEKIYDIKNIEIIIYKDLGVKKRISIPKLNSMRNTLGDKSTKVSFPDSCLSI